MGQPQSCKREAKGIPIQVVKRRVRLPPLHCRSCGVQIKKGQKYCRKCATEVSRHNIRKAAVIGRLNTHKPLVQARRADTRVVRNAALKAWNPATLPAWLNEKTYREQIRPLL